MFSSGIHVCRTMSNLCLSAIAAVCLLVLSSCYSFSGGSVPEHLKTVSIATVVDNSGFGDATFRDFTTVTLVNRFRSDNSFQLVDEEGDARLTPILARIQDRIQNVQGNFEGERRVVVTVDVEYFDAVKQRVVWKRSFENFDVYNAAQAAEDRPRAIRTALSRIVDDILLAVVSDW
jgi:Lipopolysaccharide-assembly